MQKMMGRPTSEISKYKFDFSDINKDTPIGRALPPDDGAFILENLNRYYISADNAVDEGDFNRVDRERWPDLAQKERLETMLETQSDRAERRGIEKGIKQGIEKGIEQGKRDNVERMLARRMSDAQICDLLQLDARELAAIKKELKN